jgi:ribonuclease E
MPDDAHDEALNNDSANAETREQQQRRRRRRGGRGTRADNGVDENTLPLEENGSFSAEAPAPTSALPTPHHETIASASSNDDVRSSETVQTSLPPLAHTDSLESESENSQSSNPGNQEADQPRRRRSRDRYRRDRRDRDTGGDTATRSSNSFNEHADAPPPILMADEAATSGPPLIFQLQDAPAPSTSRRRPRAEVGPDASTSAAAALMTDPAARPALEAEAPSFHPSAAQQADTANKGTVAPQATPQPTAVEMPTLKPYALPLNTLQEVATTAGLEWVHTDAEKTQQIQAAIAAQPTTPHVPREPKLAAPVDDSPLMLVETRKNLTEVKLPFDEPI